MKASWRKIAKIAGELGRSAAIQKDKELIYLYESWNITYPKDILQRVYDGEGGY